MKRQFLELYLKDQSFKSIGHILRFSHVVILNWIREFGEKLDVIQNDVPVQMMELDEMRGYIGSKKLLLDMDCY